jgi:uncharacterized OB-fold protein
MSLGNDPSKIPSGEVEAAECRYCDRNTYSPRRVCPDCRYEEVGLDAR